MIFVPGARRSKKKRAYISKAWNPGKHLSNAGWRLSFSRFMSCRVFRKKK